jgi:phosphate transport system substrate-binding protein
MLTIKLTLIRRIALAGGVALGAMFPIAAGNPAAADEIVVQGATTVASGIMSPHEAEIESASGQAINILPSSTSRGLAALVAGEADIAMLAEPLESAAKKALEKAPGSFDPAAFEGIHIGDAQTQVIINPANTVPSLNKEQVAGLLSGAIVNWKDVGGPDQEVMAITEPTSSQHKLMAEAYGFTWGPGVKEVQNASQTAQIVAQAPNAISYLSTAHQVPDRDKVKVIETGISVPLSLYLAIKKDANPEIRKVVEATVAVGKM